MVREYRDKRGAVPRDPTTPPPAPKKKEEEEPLTPELETGKIKTQPESSPPPPMPQPRPYILEDWDLECVSSDVSALPKLDVLVPDVIYSFFSLT